MTHYSFGNLYEYNGQITTGQILNNHREWLQEYCERLEMALRAYGFPNEVIGGNVKNTYVRFDLKHALGDECCNVERLLNQSLNKFGRHCDIEYPGVAIYIREITQSRRIDLHINGKEWVECKICDLSDFGGAQV
jgi:hypothetical protein